MPAKSARPSAKSSAWSGSADGSCGVDDHGFINLELPQGDADEREVTRRAADVEVAALAHRDELLRLTIEILKLQDRLQYYRQLEALHADGTIRGNN